MIFDVILIKAGREKRIKPKQRQPIHMRVVPDMLRLRHVRNMVYHHAESLEGQAEVFIPVGFGAFGQRVIKILPRIPIRKFLLAKAECPSDLALIFQRPIRGGVWRGQPRCGQGLTI